MADLTDEKLNEIFQCESPSASLSPEEISQVVTSILGDDISMLTKELMSASTAAAPKTSLSTTSPGLPASAELRDQPGQQGAKAEQATRPMCDAANRDDAQLTGYI
ncbi:hypothetical protein KEM52_005785 [Ascosphaera acerosa]|nr:hypothetical protein KEM52_005785 [Ascosphaera acerosa]